MRIRYFFYTGISIIGICCLSFSGSYASTVQSGIRPENDHLLAAPDNRSVSLPILQEKTELKQSDTIKLVVEDISFTCHEGCCGHYYENCDLHIHYNAHLKEGMSLPVATVVTCVGAIKYKTVEGDLLVNESEPVIVHRTLLTESHDRSYVSLDFAFSFYEAVVEAQLTSVKCRINREDLFSATD
jgi:hypothetical protein